MVTGKTHPSLTYLAVLVGCLFQRVNLFFSGPSGKKGDEGPFFCRPFLVSSKGIPRFIPNTQMVAPTKNQVVVCHQHPLEVWASIRFLVGVERQPKTRELYPRSRRAAEQDKVYRGFQESCFSSSPVCEERIKPQKPGLPKEICIEQVPKVGNLSHLGMCRNWGVMDFQDFHWLPFKNHSKGGAGNKFPSGRIVQNDSEPREDPQNWRRAVVVCFGQLREQFLASTANNWLSQYATNFNRFVLVYNWLFEYFV